PPSAAAPTPSAAPPSAARRVIEPISDMKSSLIAIAFDRLADLRERRHSIRVHALKQPGARGGAGRTPADNRRAVKQPDHRLATDGVVPEEVREAVAVEVAGFGDRPAARYRPRRTACYCCAVQKPDYRLSAAAVEPQDVAEAIAVEIAGAGDRPWAGHRTGRPAADHACAVEQPHQRL